MILIDKNATIKKLQEYITEMESDIYYGSNLGIPKDCICEAIEEVPTIEAEPVRYRQWVKSGGNKYPVYTCSECNCDSNTATTYCPNCGAKMKVG